MQNPSVLVQWLPFGIFVFASTVVWARVIMRLSQGQELVPACARRDVPWRSIHVLLAFFLFLSGAILADAYLRWTFEISGRSDLPTDDPVVTQWMIATASVFSLMAAAMTVICLRIDLSTTWADWGFSARHALSDVGLGIVAFLAIAPPVYVLQILLILVYRQMFDDSGLHPLIETIQSHRTPAMLFWSIVSAVLIAPIVEELLFRVVLQGWLEKFVQGVRTAIRLAGEDEQSQSSNSSVEENPYVSPDIVQQAAEMDRGIPTTPRQLIALPILLSSALFAAFHVSQGPAPIPLFFLAIVLGYLYQKTHRILPCLVVHVLLNGTTLFEVWMRQRP